jgi:predicted protein tyrosine phosphatase
MIRISNIMSALDVANEINADAIVSIVDHDIKVPDFANRKHLVVNFVDTDVHTDMFAPTMFDIQRIFDFALDRSFRSILVHCEGGISRSIATGIGLNIATGISVESAVAAAHNDSPNMSPNALVLSLIERHLGIKNLKKDVLDIVSTLPRDLMLWCHLCKVRFKDGDNCPGKHW